MLKILKWPVKSIGNFFITSLGVVGFSFWSYTIYSQSKFNQPIIGQSIKLLGKQNQVKELVGYPLSYRFSISNKFVQKQGQSYFSFQVAGPKNKVDVEMTAGAAKTGELYSSQNYQKINAIKKQIAQQQNKITSLNQQRKKAKSPRVKQIDLERISSESSLNSLRRQLVEQQFDLIDKRERYFVPEKELYTQASSHTSKGSSEPIANDVSLWGINDLVITLPNRTKMIVFPEPKKTFEQKEQIVNRYNLKDSLTLGDLNDKFTIDLSQFTKEEIEQYAAQKTSFMVTRHGSLRLFSAMLCIGLIVGVVSYKQKNVLKNLSGSIVQSQIKSALKRNPNIHNLLKQKKKKDLQYDDLVGGGIANNEFRCILYVQNLTNGRVQVEGKYSEEMNVYSYDKMVLKYVQKGEKKQIDCLL